MLRTWWIASRPFSFPASVMPIVFGTVLAVSVAGARFQPGLALLSLLAMLILHAASNILNDVFDYRRGLDREVFPVSGAVVRKLLTPEQALRGALILFAVGSLLGILVAFLSTWHILWIGLLGLVVGVGYSPGRLGLKYSALGDFAVLLNFGLLGALGAWTVQTGFPSWLPVIWALPMGLLVIGILHANNWRDIAGDKASGFHSVASLLGDRASLAYYGFLLFCPFILVLLFVFRAGVPESWPGMPVFSLLCFVALPYAVKLFKKGLKRHAPEHPEDFVGLDGATAGLNILFGALLTLGFAQYWLW